MKLHNHLNARNHLIILNRTFKINLAIRGKYLCVRKNKRNILAQ